MEGGCQACLHFEDQTLEYESVSTIAQLPDFFSKNLKDTFVPVVLATTLDTLYIFNCCSAMLRLGGDPEPLIGKIVELSPWNIRREFLECYLC